MTDTNLSKAELLANIDAGWRDLQAYLGGLRYEDVVIPTDAAGWTAKDHIAHLAVWEDTLNALLEHKPGWAHMGVDQALWDANDWDAMNAVIQQRYHDISIPELQQMFFGIHQRVLDKLDALSDADLQRPHREFQPNSTNDTPVIYWFIIDTYEHYAEHKTYIDRIIKHGAVSKADLLNQIEQGWNRLNAFVSPLRDDQLTEPTDASGWTAKDHLMHIAVWEDSINALLAHSSIRERIGVDKAAWSSADEDGQNAIVQQRVHDKPLDEVLAALRAAHEQVIAGIKALPDADLQRPMKDFDPESSGERLLISHIVGNTFEHYDEHLPWMQAIVRDEQPQTQAGTQAKLLDDIAAGWDDLNAFIDTLSEEQRIAYTDMAGWTVKDHLIHLAIWEDGIYALLERLMRVEYMGIDEATWEAGDNDRINAIIQQRYKDLSWDEVQARRTHIHGRLVEKIESLTDEDLQRPYRYYELASMEDRPVIGWIIGNTYEHYAEHLPWIEAIADSDGIASKADLLAAMQSGWDNLNAFLDSLSAEQLTIPTDAGGWTIKDHIMHLALWEGSMNHVLQKLPRRDYMGVSAATWQTGDVDAFNDEMFQQTKNLPLADVKAKFQQAHAELIGRIEALTDEDLARPFNFYQPQSAATHAMIWRLGNASFRHYDEHLPWMQAIAGKR